VSILVLVAVATGLGFLLVALTARGQGRAAADPLAAPEPGAALDWLRPHGVAGLERVVVALFTEMGFTLGPPERGRDRVGFLATDVTPIRGGRTSVLALLTPPGVAVDADEVRALIDAARGEGSGKGTLVALGGFSADAREAARDAPIELLDGDALAALVRRHLPQAWATHAP